MTAKLPLDAAPLEFLENLQTDTPFRAARGWHDASNNWPIADFGESHDDNTNIFLTTDGINGTDWAAALDAVGMEQGLTQLIADLLNQWTQAGIAKIRTARGGMSTCDST